MNTFKRKTLYAAILAGLGAIGVVASANIHSQRTYDNALLLRAVATVTATDTGTLILDMGTGKCDFDVVVDVTALDVGTGDESYMLEVQASPDATFGTAGNITTVAMLRIGGATGALIGTADAAAGGRFLFPGRNERNGTTYRYLRLKVTIAGTTPSITYSAFLAQTK